MSFLNVLKTYRRKTVKIYVFVYRTVLWNTLEYRHKPCMYIARN